MARILVLGAGFAGLWAAVGAARKLDEAALFRAKSRFSWSIEIPITTSASAITRVT
jgi:hypothetical protein